ncbi:MAG: hypothetical protein QM704_07235 [Anaeromyxobacteraceae bacterium]
MKNAIGAELQAATLNIVRSNEDVQGQQALKLIETAASTANAGSKLATAPAGNTPPPAPVQVLPKQGSTIEVVA